MQPLVQGQVEDAHWNTEEMMGEPPGWKDCLAATVGGDSKDVG